MKCLTVQESLEWLKQNEFIHAPYHNPDTVDMHHMYFKPPIEASRLTALTRSLIEWPEEFNGALIEIDDWASYKADEMEIVDAFRQANEEKRKLIDAPCHVFNSNERDKAIGLFYLTMIFHWHSYIYLLPSHTIIYNWEGDFINLWSHESKQFDEYKKTIGLFNLKIEQ